MKPVSALAALMLALGLLAGCTPPAPAPAPQISSQRSAVPAACDRAARLAASEVRAGLEAEALAAALESRGSGAPALWTLSDEDTTVHILGTVHLLRPELDWLSPHIRAAILAADRIVLEADTTSPKAQRDLIGFFARSGIFGAGEQLSSLLTPEEEAFVRGALDNTNLPLDALQTMRPWFAAINISVMQITENGFDPGAGVESVIERMTQGRDVTFAFLETVDEQLGGLAGLEDCEQVNFLLATVESLEVGVEMLDVLVDEWVDGDVRGLGLLMANPVMLGSQAIYDVMLTDRNRRWVPQIVAMLDEPGTVLVAVGAGHLAGADSVITMLRDEGFSVEGP
jgi:uncharacterized protein YbaP (TraB family)